jgi:hypothetical protein
MDNENSIDEEYDNIFDHEHLYPNSISSIELRMKKLEEEMVELKCDVKLLCQKYKLAGTHKKLNLAKLVLPIGKLKQRSKEKKR